MGTVVAVTIPLGRAAAKYRESMHTHIISETLHKFKLGIQKNEISTQTLSLLCITQKSPPPPPPPPQTWPPPRNIFTVPLMVKTRPRLPPGFSRGEPKLVWRIYNYTSFTIRLALFVWCQQSFCGQRFDICECGIVRQVLLQHGEKRLCVLKVAGQVEEI